VGALDSKREGHKLKINKNYTLGSAKEQKSDYW
jgi:hypothetical protein